MRVLLDPLKVKTMNKENDLSPIFIGGTGRSGTTILSSFIGSNSEVVKIPLESRFILDKNGLIDLFSSLTYNYSIDQARVAIREFERKMILEMSNPYKGPYLGWNLQYKINKTSIVESTNQLVEEITKGYFKGRDFSTEDKRNFIWKIRKLLYPFNRVIIRLSKDFNFNRLTFMEPSLLKMKPDEKIYIPKYFEEEELLKVLRSFIKNVFKETFEGKLKASFWCEDTPANILNMDFLMKLYPQAKFINVLRHPVAVVYSMQKIFWAPNDLKKCCDYLEGIFERLSVVHLKYSSNNNYFFMRLEDFTETDHYDSIVSFLKLDFKEFSGKINIDLDRMNSYIKKMKPEDINYIQNRLSKYIILFGYEFFEVKN